MTVRLLLLFDIDGTLLVGATSAHRQALDQALREVHGVSAPPAFVATAGRTDRAICRSILLLGGVDAKVIDDRMQDVCDAAVAAYARLCQRDLSEFVAPSAQTVLAGTAAAGHLLSLVTGNLEAIAHLKLGRAGIGGHFARGQGGFGSDDEDRAALPAVARTRATAGAEPHPRGDTVVIGDTPLDVACAHADRVRCIAVTTGPHSAQDLQEAEIVIETLADLPAALLSL